MDLREVSSASHRRHPWEVARARFFRRTLADAGGPSRRPCAVLDVGAGDGYVARELLDALPARSEVVCVDPSYTDDDLGRFAAEARAGLSFARQAPERSFDVILLLDVIEHVPDDRAFLGDLVARRLAPGGLVLVSVPAWQALFSAHDTAIRHYRRYSPAALRALLDAAALETVRGGGLFHSLLAPRFFEVAREKVGGLLGRPPAPPANLGQWRGGAFVTGALERALAVDNALSRALARRGLGLPGLSVWALCRARDGARS
jgi:SAM-dependent methyltransferase